MLRTAKAQRQLTWRQWVVLKDGCAFALLSALDAKNEAALLPDVEAMVQSFRVKPASGDEKK